MAITFKQGDLVRLTKDYYQYLKEGEVGRIYAPDGSNCHIWSIEIPYDSDTEIEEGEYPFFRHFVHEDYLELVNESN